MKPLTNTRVYSLSLLLVLSVLSPVALSIGSENPEWSCTSGESIAAENVCDGQPHCPDGSDETSSLCIQRSCPPYSFRCAYGGCVAETARCNRTRECADGSDEAQVLCQPDKKRENPSCPFQCLSGECIDEDDVCDGVSRCKDQSDETVEACAATVCEEPFFRCGYGACIKANNKCDRKIDCRDGSDESLDLCSMPPPKAQPTRPTPRPKPSRPLSGPPMVTMLPIYPSSSVPISPVRPVTPVTPAPPPTRPIIQPKTSCTAPSIKNSRIVSEADPTKVIRPGEEVPNLMSVIYECQSGYFREGLHFNLCLNGSWFSTVQPECTVYCPHEVLKGVTFKVACARDGATVPCNNRIKPGTIGQVSCPTKYRIPDYNPTQTLFCDEAGHWDYSPFRCEPICGEELVPSVPFLVNGKVTNITSVPWHVGIYKKISNDYNHHCGGTLISAKVVISAAHCFWDQAKESIQDKDAFIVAAGKFFRDFNTVESRKAQFQNVSHIGIPNDYKGEDAKYKADIAILVLTHPFILSEYISPICIAWHKDGAKTVTSGLFGQIAGWGKDENGEYSSELKTIQVPVNSYESCISEVEPQLKDSVTPDKFCALNSLNTNACQGDSGGGFTFKKVINGKIRHYLWGVVSSGVPYGLRCSHFSFVTFTNIQYYESFVTSLETPNRPK